METSEAADVVSVKTMRTRLRGRKYFTTFSIG